MKKLVLIVIIALMMTLLISGVSYAQSSHTWKIYLNKYIQGATGDIYLDEAISIASGRVGSYGLWTGINAQSGNVLQLKDQDGDVIQQYSGISISLTGMLYIVPVQDMISARNASTDYVLVHVNGSSVTNLLVEGDNNFEAPDDDD